MRRAEDIAKRYAELFGEAIPPEVVDRIACTRGVCKPRQRRTPLDVGALKQHGSIIAAKTRRTRRSSRPGR